MLLELLQSLNITTHVRDVDITGLQNDSRYIQPGNLFIAYPGAVSDGRKYIPQAIAAGASAVLYDNSNFEFTGELPTIGLSQLNEKLAILANKFYKNPSAELSITGVTGTNGKTTIAYQLAQAYELLGNHSAYIGTLGQGKVQSLELIANTTPDALCLQRLLNDYFEQQINYVCMEVSSHALSLGRVDCIDFDQAIYTNLSLDHLDFHKTMDAYARAKAKLFEKTSLNFAIINQDDKYSEIMKKAVPSSCQLLTYGLQENADVRLLSWETGMHGSHLNVLSPWGEHVFEIQSLGKFNLYNSLAIFTSLLASGIATPEKIISVMTQLKASPGRMEIVSKKPCVIVDFAHTPDALENVLQTLNQVKKAKIWVVFGCGGDRDRSKRPVMGRIAGEYADRIILTNDNPRTEYPDNILRDIAAGLSNKSYDSISDRKKAIQFALEQASAEDIILIAGKGHEDYQIIGNVKQPFSDQNVVRELLSL